MNDNNSVDCKTIRRLTAEKEIKNNDLDFWAELSLWKFSFEIWKFRSGNRVLAFNTEWQIKNVTIRFSHIDQNLADFSTNLITIFFTNLIGYFPQTLKTEIKQNNNTLDITIFRRDWEKGKCFAFYVNGDIFNNTH